MCVAACALLGAACGGSTTSGEGDDTSPDVADTRSVDDIDATCQPAPAYVCCGSAVCLDDGCGPQTIVESCADGCTDGACNPCVPACGDRACGDDGCGGSCGSCEGGEVCGDDGTCACVDAGELGCCGDDVCAVDSCGNALDQVATCEWGCGEGECLPCDVPCGDQACGDNACGESCGTCDGGAACLGGTCTCVKNDHQACCPDGAGVCAYDSCGGVGAVIAACENGCVDGTCASCEPACDGKSCGADGCGGSCGGCDGGAVCDADGACVCVPEVAYACCEDGASLCAVDSCGVVGAVTAACPGGCQDGVCASCAPACDGKACGPDGCNGSCGTCDGEGEVCVAGQCTCVPAVGTACCGDAVCPVDSCGVKGDAVEACAYGCASGACQPCVPACDGKDCGDDGCGGTCGDAPCDGGEICVEGVCSCVDEGATVCCGADGASRCGVDSCGQSLGTLGVCDYGCADGACLPCPVDCTDRECGDDGCGGSCGDCDGGTQCVTGACVCVSAASVACCGDARCAYDSCGNQEETLEPCPWGCTDGACLPCPADCTGRVCGDNGCGGSCGDCAADEVCTLAGACTDCQPMCDGVSCGDDGCGGSCGTCDAPLTCDDGQCAAVVTGRFLRERYVPNATLTQLAPLDTVPVAGITVYVSADGAVLGSAETAADGSFAIALSPAPTAQITVTLSATLVDDAGQTYLGIANAAGVSWTTVTTPHQVINAAVWAWAVDPPSDSLDVGEVTITTAEGSGALQILGWLRDARARVVDYYNATSAPSLGVLWNPDVTPLCLSCFFPNGYGPLRIPGEDGPVDFGRFIWYSGKTTAPSGQLSAPHQWTPSMIGHEFGHYVMDVFSRSPNEGGAHSWDQLYNAGLAWSEGWADFFGQWWLSAVASAEQSRFFAVQQGTQYWIDFDRIGTAPTSDDSVFVGLIFPLPNPSGTMTQNMNEAVVAAMLWDMFDADDALGEGEVAAMGDVVLDTLRSQRMLSATLNRGYSKADLVDFLDAIRCANALTIEQLTPTLFGFPYDNNPSCP
ncbi:MAG: hypothetical protein EP329_14660 [Deltaproteobacteria bacterium]|nr:MAG: hypothetical protein EP329_14660 [Deltaproteobacteria bacterium]